MAPVLSIVVPTLDEAAGIAAHLAPLQPLRAEGCEVIVVDGGSRDGTPALARPLADAVLSAPRGRGPQLNAGAAAARADLLLFLHADTRLPPGAVAAVRAALAGGRRDWGRFDLAIAGRHPLLPLVARLVSWRSRFTGIATGDQAIFVRRARFEAAGRFPEIPLMEDLALSAALRRAGRPACLRERVVTSGRRWESRGVLRTVLLMWWLRFLFWAGRDPADLARRYG
ncbi:TIGR04283 family arsenosugar biosynthesis glycosyltransferase [Anaeromyxobacter paludicola]|uniref:Glycosyl transferase n=1 Tax=Anaeromyxobacter paludicola TaxID=2918171 RepID=A0ABN6NCG2_9BACT|nr:TIGR04283 family arsenosugar biosynthesis glycosyltransferase [Anaeromyxobacter paludicola]BDG10008.1 glycosyl transferase [Anaeromyxobacter paludicola]